MWVDGLMFGPILCFLLHQEQTLSDGTASSVSQICTSLMKTSIWLYILRDNTLCTCGQYVNVFQHRASFSKTFVSLSL